MHIIKTRVEAWLKWKGYWDRCKMVLGRNENLFAFNMGEKRLQSLWLAFLDIQGTYDKVNQIKLQHGVEVKGGLELGCPLSSLLFHEISE